MTQVIIIKLLFGTIKALHMGMTKLLIKYFGVHGKRHLVREVKLLKWMDNNGIGG